MIEIPSIPYFNFIQELYKRSKFQFYGINFNDKIESYKVYFRLVFNDYIRIYSNFFNEVPKCMNKIGTNVNDRLNNILNSFPTIGLKIKTNGFYYLTFYHLIECSENKAIIESIDTETNNKRTYLYEPYQSTKNYLFNLDIPEHTYLEICTGNTIRGKTSYYHNKLSFIPAISIKLNEHEQRFYDCIQHTYTIVGNAMDDQGYKAYYFLSNEHLYTIIFNFSSPNYLLNPYTWVYHSYILENLETIYEDYLTHSSSMDLVEAVNWIKESSIESIQKHPYEFHEGYEKGYSEQTWIFIPIYKKDWQNEVYINTLNIIHNCTSIKMAGFMILKKDKSIELHRHAKQSRILHYTLSHKNNHPSNVTLSVMSKDMLHKETISMNHFGNSCMFHTTDYHETINESLEDRVSFVIEIE